MKLLLFTLIGFALFGVVVAPDAVLLILFFMAELIAAAVLTAILKVSKKEPIYEVNDKLLAAPQDQQLGIVLNNEPAGVQTSGSSFRKGEE